MGFLSKEGLKKYATAWFLGGVFFLILGVYIYFRRGYFDLYIANKVIAGDSAILLITVFLLGPFSRFFDIFDKYLPLRKEIGITAFFLALAHSLISLAKYFSGISWPFIAGLTGLIVLIILFLISFKRTEVWLGESHWWMAHNWGLRLAVVLVILHVFSMKLPGWIRWYQVGGDSGLARPELPGASLLLAWLMFFAVLIRLSEFGGMRFGRFITYLSLALLPIIYLVTFWWGSLSVRRVTACITTTAVEVAVNKEKRCLVIFDSNVYDLTLANKWDITGHVGKHLCGKAYTKDEIEKGPHSVSVMDKFLLAKLCPGQ